MVCPIMIYYILVISVHKGNNHYKTYKKQHPITLILNMR